MAEMRMENVRRIARGITGWGPSDPTLRGEVLQFTFDNAVKLLADPNRGWLLVQINTFLRADRSFLPGAANG